MSVFQMSIVGGILIIIIAIIRTAALNKLPKKTFLVLWGIVLLRLLFPFSIPSQLSVYNAFDLNIISQNQETENPLLDKSNASSNEAFQTEPIISNGNVETITPNETGKPLPETDTEPSVSTKKNAEFNTDPIIALWLFGAVSFAVFFMIVFIRSNRVLRFAIPIHNNSVIDDWIVKNKLPHRISILQSDMIKTPIAAGIFKPRIILPKTMELNDEQLLLYVLAHEYFHIKRFDIVWKIICALAICVHWFNPLVWLMFALLGRDLELACDEAVLRRYGENKKQFYAYSIINMSEQLSKINPLYSGFSKNKTAERIIAIMKYKKFSITTITVAVLLIVGTTATFAFNGSDNENQIPENIVSENTQNNPVNADVTNAESNDIENLGSDTFTIEYSSSEFEKEYHEYQNFINKQSLDLTNLLSEQSNELQETLSKQADDLNEFLNAQEPEYRIFNKKVELDEEFQASLNEQEIKLQEFLNEQEKTINELTSKFDNQLNELVNEQEAEYNDWLKEHPIFKRWYKEKEKDITPVLTFEEFQALQDEGIKRFEQSRQEFEDKLNENKTDFKKSRQEFEKFMDEQRQAFEAFILKQRNELFERRINTFIIS